MLKFLFVLPTALLLAFLPQEPSATPDKPLPADAATLTNPVSPTSQSQAHAKTLYDMDCAICHGTNGNGKGDLVADMGLKLRDFTSADSLKDLTDGQLFYIIKDGRGKMPSEGPRVKSDAEIWNLVILVRSLGKK